MNNIEKHFNTFYNRLVFLDSKLGENEKTFTYSFYWTTKKEESGKYLKSTVYEEKVKDEQIYIRNKGLILTLVYGTGYNKKYKTLNVYIKKDPYYQGNEEPNIAELLSLLDSYIDTHYKEFYEKINKHIYSENPDKIVSVKYRPANILSRDLVKSISISDTIIKNKDIEHLKNYPNIHELKINNSTINATNLGIIPLSLLMLGDSKIKSMRCLDGIKTNYLSIFRCVFPKDEHRSLTIEANKLNLDNNENLNMAAFFLNTNFKNVNEVSFERMELNPLEVSLLPVFYNAKELEACGEANSYAFLSQMPELEFMQGYIKLLSDNNLDTLKKRYKEKLEKHNLQNRDRINNYIWWQISETLRNHKEFWEEIHLSKLALQKYQGIINNSNTEYVKKILALPLSIRKNIGQEKNINFVETSFIDPFKITLNNINKTYLSKIVGRDGEQLIKPVRRGYTDEYYILGPNGNIISGIQKTAAREVTVPEHYEEIREDIVENDNNKLDYYYNRTFSEPVKLRFLAEKIKAIYEPAHLKTILDKNNQLKARRKELEDIEENLSSYNGCLSILSCCPRHQYVDKVEEKNGKTAVYLEQVPDDFIEEDTSLYAALKRTRNPNIIAYSLRDIFKEENISDQKQKEIKVGISELLKIWEEQEKLDNEIIEEDILVAEEVENLFPEITEIIKNSNYAAMYLDDIEEFLSAYQLNNEEHEILYDYILMLQCRNRNNYLTYLNELENRQWILREFYSVDYLISYIEDIASIVDFETALKNGNITSKEYEQIREFLNNINEIKRIKDILDIDTIPREKAYAEMIPKINALNTQQLIEIKEQMLITNENKPRFDKFVDFLYNYFYGTMPPWIELELAKCPQLLDKYRKTSTRKLVKEESFKIDECVKIVHGPFAY